MQEIAIGGIKVSESLACLLQSSVGGSGID
jgi:hypothetical protein